jgi:DNA-binding transcriptional LysR family regulator
MIDKLEFIIALAREKHFSRAAEACGVSQPTFSAGIKQLEETFGVLLVQRGSRFRGFTPEGERVLEWARRIVGDTRAMRQDIDALNTSIPRSVSASCPRRRAKSSSCSKTWRSTPA